MRVSMEISNTMTMIAEMENDSKFQILEYDKLKGARSTNLSENLYFMDKSGVKLKQPRIILEESGVKLQAGSLNYMKGNIIIKNRTSSIAAFGKKLLGGIGKRETVEKPLFQGTGELFLEPTFGHFVLLELQDEEIVVDDGLFYACEETIEIEPFMQKNISSMLYGDEGIYQLSLKGEGIVLLEVPVPESEIFRCKLYQDTLKVDGDFAILRTENIDYKVEKSGTSLIGSGLDGEGLLNVYSGTGEVWLIPTDNIYRQLEESENGKFSS